MFRTSYVHNQEGYIVHAVLYGTFSKRFFKQSARLSTEHILQYGRLLAQTYGKHTI